MVFLCTLCDKLTCEPDNYYHHVYEEICQRKKPSDLIDCDYCSQYYSSVSNLNRHIKVCQKKLEDDELRAKNPPYDRVVIDNNKEKLEAIRLRGMGVDITKLISIPLPLKYYPIKLRNDHIKKRVSELRSKWSILSDPMISEIECCIRLLACCGVPTAKALNIIKLLVNTVVQCQFDPKYYPEGYPENDVVIKDFVKKIWYQVSPYVLYRAFIIKEELIQMGIKNYCAAKVIIKFLDTLQTHHGNRNKNKPIDNDAEDN
jgi:hypothetical protein